MKRLLDLAFVVPAAAVVAPLVGALAIAVRVGSKGPAFFVQERVGRNRRPVKIVKLRTMVSGADRMGAHVTAKGDPRITRLGAVLRATKVDELPQLWNVIIGDMSLVGPRPEAPRYAASYQPEWERVFTARPGITDLASLVFRDEEKLLDCAVDRERAYVEAVLPAKMKLALEGVDRASLAFDVSILFRTLCVVFRLSRADTHPAVAEARRAIDQVNRRTTENR